ncbi:MAG: choice-of-anchor B family protein [Pseudomonadota bacterium]
MTDPSNRVLSRLVNRAHRPRVTPLLVSALLGAGAAWACPTPVDSDSRYNRIPQMSVVTPRAQPGDTVVPLPRATVPLRSPEAATPCVDGFAGPYPCQNVDLAAIVPLSDIGGGEGNDIWGWTDPLTGREYAIMGRTNGTAFVDISEPEAPRYLGNLPTHTSSSPWRDVKVYDNHAYVVAEASGHGMQVFDLTQLRGLTGPPLTFLSTAHYGEFGASHNIVVNEDSGFAYAVGTRNNDDGCAGGLHMIDIRTPGSPQFAGCYAADGYTHDAQCVTYTGPDPDYNTGNREICFNYNEDTLTIVDVTDKGAPVLISRTGYFGSGYTHQGWVTDDQRYVLLDDEGEERDFGHNTKTYVWNIENLDNPVVISSYLAPTAAIDHNLYIRGNYAFQANYRAGVRILDLEDIASGTLRETGFFDFFPSNDAASFNGAWSLYPYFASGVVIASGIEQGLIVLRPDVLALPFTLQVGDPALSVCGAGQASTDVSLAAGPVPSGDVTLSVDGLPAGVAAQFADPVLSVPGATTLTLSGAGAAPGSYALTVSGDNGQEAFGAPLRLAVSSTLPQPAVPTVPADGAAAVSSLQALYWNAVPGAQSYDVELATDAGFTNVIASGSGLAEPVFTPPAALAPATQYFWRVTARNACGAAAATTASFVTAGEACTLFASADTPVVIPDDQISSVTSMISVVADGVVADVDVIALRGTHTWINDISMQLEGPLNVSARSPASRQRPVVQIMNQSCDDEDDFELSFDDEAPPGPWPCPPVGSGTYQPSNPLSAFDGSAGSGDWVLTVNDSFALDGGQLDAWGLRVCVTPEPEVPVDDSDGDGVGDAADNCTLMANPAQRDTDGDGFGNFCDPDLNNDGVVNFEDLALMRQAFFSMGDLDADLNGDGLVNFVDLGLQKTLFFQPPGPSGIAR